MDVSGFNLKDLAAKGLAKFKPQAPAVAAPTPTPAVATAPVVDAKPAAAAPKTPKASMAERFWQPGLDYKDTEEFQTYLADQPEEVQQRGIRQWASQEVPTDLPDLDTARQALTKAFKLTQQQGYEDLGQQRLAAYPQQLEKLFDAQGMTPEQRQSFMQEAMAGAMGIPELPAEATPEQQQMRETTLQGAAKLFQPRIDKAIADTEANFGAVMEAAKTTESNWSDFGSYLTSNWANLVTPVGLLLSLFGGNGMTRVLGLMGAAFGGHNLYERYKVMADPNHEANPYFTKAIELATIDTSDPGNVKPLPSPFSNLPQVQNNIYEMALQHTGDPKKAQQLAGQTIQGVKDFQFASSVGFGDMIQQQGKDRVGAARRVYNFTGQPQPQPVAP